MKTKHRYQQGFALPMVIGIVAVFLILLPALVTWIQHDTKMAVKDQKSTMAFNLAEAGIDRGMWKLKSSTETFRQARVGTAISGYQFDTVYPDISGGVYRIKFSTGSSANEVTIIAEGRDVASREVRAIRAVYKNMSIPGSIISGGVITWANALSAHWGPVMAHGNINITDANAAKDYFPRKFSRQVVRTTIGSYHRDTNGINPPNTDNLEWWSDYPVPELPILDFTALRASATATSTLNIFGCSKMTSGVVGAPWWGSNVCSNGTGSNHNGMKHFQNSYNHPLARKGYTFYWDGDVVMTGDTGTKGHGIWGNVIVRGTLTNWAGDNYPCTVKVPSTAYEEYAKIDTSSKNQFPGDDGYQKVRTTFGCGSESWTGGPSPTGNTDVGFRGFIYVGGDFNIQGPADIYGALWVNGNVSKASGAERTVVFFNDQLDLPTLNVILVRQSWNEIVPSSTPWP